jgi:hypothetical protein
VRRAPAALLALLAGLLPALLRAGPAAALDDADRAGVQAAIGGQIEAFRRDDAAGAYAYAAPGIRSIFPSEDGFLAMVRRAYPPVYRPRRFTYRPLEEGPEGFVQRVEIQDADGQDWVARYTLERRPDGSFAITGCTLERVPGESV